MYPALAVAQALRDAQPDLDIRYVGGARGFERRIVADAALAMPYQQLVVRSLRSGGRDVHLVLDPLRLAASIPQAWWLLARMRPDVVFTTGGYLGIPLVMAARSRGIPSLVWEGNVVPGRATRAVGRVATAVAVSFPPTLAAFPNKGFVSGTPIRSFEDVDRGEARRSLGVADADRLLLVFGGSQAVMRLNRAVIGALPRILGEWHVLHVTGDLGLADAESAGAAIAPPLRDRYRPVPFLTDGMTEALVAADVVLGRAGSSTCAEIAAAGVASILVPYPFAGAHQCANAAWLAGHGAAIEVPDGEMDADRLVAELSSLRVDGRRRGMARAAAALGRPGAARTIAEALIGLANGGAAPVEVSPA